MNWLVIPIADDSPLPYFPHIVWRPRVVPLCVDVGGQDDKFYLGRRLGSGSFGQVFLAKNRRGKELAVKVESLGSCPGCWKNMF